jgi:hypothetical protein
MKEGEKETGEGGSVCMDMRGKGKGWRDMVKWQEVR